MKFYQINRLIAVAAIATLSMACGTGSPTGPDVTSNATVSALRFAPTEPFPPQAPEAPLPPSGEAPSPEPIPDPLPSPRPLPTVEVPPASGTEPVPAPPADDSGVDTIPNDPNIDGPAGSDPTPQPSPGPNTNPGTPGGSVPPPAADPQTPAGSCLASSIEILPLVTFAGTNGVALEATLRGKDGLEITDSSCKLLWTADTSEVVITEDSSSRFVTVSGKPGTYKIGAATGNGVSASVVVVLQ